MTNFEIYKKCLDQAGFYLALHAKYKNIGFQCAAKKYLDLANNWALHAAIIRQEMIDIF